MVYRTNKAEKKMTGEKLVKINLSLRLKKYFHFKYYALGVKR